MDYYFFVFDGTSLSSLEGLKKWLDIVKQEKRGIEINGRIVCNKIDLPNQAIKDEELNQLEKNYGFKVYKTSLTDFKSVRSVFEIENN